MLTFHFQKNLRDFQLDINIELDNKTLSLIGHSGCGKTTTLQLLAGLQKPEQGQMILNGREIINTESNVFIPAENRRIGYVFQDYALFPHLSVRENILYGIRQFDRSDQENRLADVLSLLQLEAFEDVFPANLSGGQQQRVAIARALVTQPELLLLDEPLSALDVSTRGHVRTELKTLLDSLSIPCIVVTHDFEDARVLGDEMAVIDKGKLIQIGTPESLAKAPSTAFVAEFIGTNLIVQGHSEQTAENVMIAFDPWQTHVSRASTGERYEWTGVIKDISYFGAFNRLYIEGAHRLMADIPIQSNGFDLGEQVFIAVKEQEARVYQSRRPIEEPLNQIEDSFFQKKAVLKRRRLKKIQMIGTMVSMILVIGLLIVFSGMKGFAGTGHSTKQTTMVALIAANATDPVNDIISQYEKSHPELTIKASYAGTQIIQTQLEQGDQADFFLSADLSHIQSLKKEGLVKKFYKVSNNHEVIIVPKNNPAHITSLKDLANKKTKLIIGVDNVPIGQYTRQVFQNAAQDYGAQFENQVMDHVASTETNVKQILEKVSMGDGDAGVVYLTDVTAAYKNKVRIIQIPKAYNVVSSNYIAVPTHAPHPKKGQSFLKYMRSSKGQAVFKKLHYDPIN
ncbi:molybdate ABC transporter substrate-binding protein [Pullulanibacillus sp. KACC 23026]|uniref:molybdate ABC transporter substrate-binding protein n=1 Tax=Pullulanibacillus sp. KACC 23026 TaxID=3028315 RepID=UPI0023B1612A|nr:molybdate ABC transporter substrate-binding protein [Pullulanibacillus sp. KACC 23026]WEG14607.1 molybdate ABC transporter substrate-binding protein [Pullulanibacillus sp. KACC 23026]